MVRVRTQFAPPRSAVSLGCHLRLPLLCTAEALVCWSESPCAGQSGPLWRAAATERRSSSYGISQILGRRPNRAPLLIVFLCREHTTSWRAILFSRAIPCPLPFNAAVFARKDPDRNPFFLQGKGDLLKGRLAPDEDAFYAAFHSHSFGQVTLLAPLILTGISFHLCRESRTLWRVFRPR
jgi:hypothetical protein